MKRILSVIVAVTCLLLSACKPGASVEARPVEDPVQSISVESTPTSGIPSAEQYETAYRRDMTLTFYFGVRTGRYTGSLLNGLPHGYGSFRSYNEQGVKWVYAGEWDMGHMQGEGLMRYETGYEQTGWYENDYPSGQGSIHQDDRLLFEGEFAKGIPNGEGTLYDYRGEIIFSGIFTQGYINETEEARNNRVGLFRESCVEADYDALLESAQAAGDLRVKVSGTACEVLEPGELGYVCNFIMVLPDGNTIGVSYNLSVGENPVTMGEKVDVWGIADCLCTNSATQVSIPQIEAWDVQDAVDTTL